MLPAARRIGGLIMLLAAMVSPTLGQERIRVEADVLFYGDNTEFRNPFREGETIFGTAGRISVAVDLSERVVLRGGAHGLQRFGSDEAFDFVRPVLSLSLTGPRSLVVLGTLPAAGSDGRRSPGDRGTLHGLLPPLQRETLIFERSYENGLLWTFAGAGLRTSTWLNWQRLNTPAHRERFDGGMVGEIALTRHLFVPAQVHLVHDGGQLHASGPVADSYAGALGVLVRWPESFLGLASLEAHALGSRHVPDRETPERSRTGRAVLMRAATDVGPWRGHLLFWRGRDFVKAEGDANYLSIRRDGRYYGGTRDYAEAGLSRSWTPAPDVRLDAAARLHRTERHYEYSVRLMAKVTVGWPR